MCNDDKVNIRPTLSMDKEQFITSVADVINEILNSEVGLRANYPNAKIESQKLVLGECYRGAQSVADVFSTNGGLNYYRESGLYCYWLRKLKPFNLKDIPSNNLTGTESLINEFIAYYYAMSMIATAQAQAFDEIRDKKLEINENNIDAFLANNERLMNANYKKNEMMELRIINSFRYHPYSFGSIPMLLEAMFSLPLDEYAAR